MRFGGSLSSSRRTVGKDAARSVLRRQMVERAGVGETQQVAPRKFLQHFYGATTLQNGADRRQLMDLVLTFDL